MMAERISTVKRDAFLEEIQVQVLHQDTITT